jgi:hypothetical protein
MQFDPDIYGERVSAILALDGAGQRLMPLVSGTCSSAEAGRMLLTETSGRLFPAARAPEAALAGLWLYFSCLEESHSLSQEIHTPDGSFWHGIMHRQEPDPANAAYWFRRVGRHPIFPALAAEGSAILARNRGAKFQIGSVWDPVAFIDFAGDVSSSPGSSSQQAALQIQRAEWQLLFDYCARPNE